MMVLGRADPLVDAKGMQPKRLGSAAYSPALSAATYTAASRVGVTGSAYGEPGLPWQPR